MGLGGGQYVLTPKSESTGDKARTSWALATRIYLLSTCLLQSQQQGWFELQVPNLKAAESTHIFSLSYSMGEAEAVNIWKHLSAASF